MPKQGDFAKIRARMSLWEKVGNQAGNPVDLSGK
jgi:hypothetical protein